MSVANALPKLANVLDLNGPGRALYTPGRMRIDVDPVNGDDDASFVLGVDADPTSLGRGSLPTYKATVKTIQGAFDRIPWGVLHPVMVYLPAGTLTPPTGLITGGPDLVIRDHWISNEVRWLDEGAFTYDAFPGIYVNGAKNVVVAPQTADIFSSTTIGKASLAMATDEHRGAVVEITANTGVGQWRRVARNTGTTLLDGDAWLTTPNGTSVFQVWRPGTKIAGSVTVTNVFGAFACPGVVFSPEIEIDGPTSLGLIAGSAWVTFAGTVTGDSIASHRAMQFGPASVLYPQWNDAWRDPLFLAQVPAYVSDGEVLFYDAHNIINGSVWCAVMDRARLTLTDFVLGLWKIDADGWTGAARSPYPFLTLQNGTNFTLAKGSHSGSSVKRYNKGAVVERGAYLDAPNCDLSDHTAEGVSLDDGSGANLRGVTAATPNGTYGATLKGQSRARANRSATTIAGVSGAFLLGNAASGVSHAAWTDVAAGDAISDLTELSTVVDR